MKSHYLPYLFLVLFYACQSSSEEQQPIGSEGLLLSQSSLPEYEKNIDHAKLIGQLDESSLKRGQALYGKYCFNCHGDDQQPGSIPNAFRFWRDTFKYGKEPYKIYETLTRGFGLMPPQIQLVPRQKYDIIHFIRENFLRENNSSQYFEMDEDYLSKLPMGDNIGPESVEWEPWKDMDYGRFLINTYQIVDKNAGPRGISRGRSPLPNEDYSSANFAYKGIAIRLDSGAGGVAKGNAWIIFDHDLMRVAAAWTGEEFIDWRAILLNGEHNIYPRISGDLQFENPIGPGWANPQTNSFEDPRFKGLDGRPFGPLPRTWAQYKGLYQHENKIIIKYAVGDAEVLENFEVEYQDEHPVFVRTLNISSPSNDLFLRIAPDDCKVLHLGQHTQLLRRDGFYVVQVPKARPSKVKLLISTGDTPSLESWPSSDMEPEDLSNFTNGGPNPYPEKLSSVITPGSEDQAYTVDVLQLPVNSPWNSRFQLSGIDFIPNSDKALVCTVGGDVWKVSGITQESGQLTWQRMASGLFQPLGIKVHRGDIYVSCRDQIVILRDLNGDGVTDFYESFNSDHQVTEHFHEFAMGLQVDKDGNFYYAKSARHARTPLVPQHGTLLRVSPDGSKTDIIANGFRAANGVCLNPDGTFIVTDQEGHWNPMNRINWVQEGGFYGNMYGYGAPKDSSDSAMEPPLCWVDKELDRSPSELLWVDSERWGPLNGGLLNFSYGYGKILVVLTEKINQTRQGGLFELPIPKFSTGVMRGRFHPGDGQLYACGMSAWGTNQVIQSGGFYRVRYTGQPFFRPIALNVRYDGLNLTFSDPLDVRSAQKTENFEVKVWDLKRTRNYGSDHYNVKTLPITGIELSPDQKTLQLFIPDIAPTWAMEISYDLQSSNGKQINGKIQNTIHVLDEMQ